MNNLMVFVWEELVDRILIDGVFNSRNSGVLMWPKKSSQQTQDNALIISV